MDLPLELILKNQKILFRDRQLQNKKIRKVLKVQNSLKIQWTVKMEAQNSNVALNKDQLQQKKAILRRPVTTH